MGYTDFSYIIVKENIRNQVSKQCYANNAS